MKLGSAVIVVAIVGLVLAWGLPNSASATIELYDVTDGIVLASGPDSTNIMSYSGTAGGGVFRLDSVGGCKDCLLTGYLRWWYPRHSTITNVSDSAATISLLISAQDFPYPSFPMNFGKMLVSSFSVKPLNQNGSGNSFSYQTWADPTNALGGTTPGLTSGLVGPINFDAARTGDSIYDTNRTLGELTYSPSYSMTMLANFTLASGESIGFGGAESVWSAYVPEPPDLPSCGRRIDRYGSPAHALHSASATRLIRPNV